MRLRDLLHRLVDFDLLTRFDRAHCRMFSTWDKTGGNSDGGDFMRFEDDRAILAEMKGPGTIMRLYTARPDGKIRIYLDGASKPVVDIKAADFWSGQTFPYVAPLVGRRGGGFYNFFPIPYAESCRVELEIEPTPAGRLSAYCQCTYLTFEPGTAVESFTGKLAKTDREALERVVQTYRNVGQDPKGPLAGQEALDREFRVKPGEAFDLANLSGPGAIDAVRIELPEVTDHTLREVLLRGYWDGLIRPSVDAPIGDFFCNAFAQRPFKSLPVGLDGKTYYCYFVMPFDAAALLQIVNQGPAAVEGKCHIVWRRTATHSPTVGRFCAKWRREDVAAVDLGRANIGGHYNYTILDATGEGRYIGCNLNVLNRWPRWWGEGDPMIFVDDDTWPPSFHGTGTEEYFNDAWGFHEGHMPLSGAMLAGPDGTPSAQRCFDWNAVYTWHIADSIPFKHRIRVTLEHGTENDFANDYASVAYWYHRVPGNHDFFVMRPARERLAEGKGSYVSRYGELREAFCQMRLTDIRAFRRMLADFQTALLNVNERIEALRRWHYYLRIVGADIRPLAAVPASLNRLKGEELEAQRQVLDNVYRTLCEFTDDYLRRREEVDRA